MRAPLLIPSWGHHRHWHSLGTAPPWELVLIAAMPLAPPGVEWHKQLYAVAFR